MVFLRSHFGSSFSLKRFGRCGAPNQRHVWYRFRSSRKSLRALWNPSVLIGNGWGHNATRMLTCVCCLHRRLLPYFATRSDWRRRQKSIGDPKWSCWRSAKTDPQVILLAFQYLEDYKSTALESLAGPHFQVPSNPFGLCRLAGPRFIGNVVFNGSLLLRRRVLPPEQEHLSGLWEDSERLPGFVSLTVRLSPRPEVVKLRLRSPLSGTGYSSHSDDVCMMLQPCSTPLPPPDTPFYLPFLPNHLVTSIHSMAPRTAPTIYIQPGHLVPGIYPIAPRQCM